MSGFLAAREIRARVPRTGIVMLSTHKDKQFIEEAHRCGATCFVSKSEVVEELVGAIKDAANDKQILLD
jgi:DNA-binding NarL/FixJ family response regulator